MDSSGDSRYLIAQEVETEPNLREMWKEGVYLYRRGVELKHEIMDNLLFLFPLAVVVGAVALSIPVNQALIAWGEKAQVSRQRQQGA